MVEIEVRPIPDDPVTGVQGAIAALGLTVAMDGKLARFPDSRHWHLRRHRCAGTLEVTWHPAGGRMWVAYHANRVGDGWVAEVAPKLVELLGHRHATSNRQGDL